MQQFSYRSVSMALEAHFARQMGYLGEKRPREKAKLICFDCDDFGGGFGDGDGTWEDMIGGLPHMYGRRGVRMSVFLGSLLETGSWGASDGGVLRGLAGGLSRGVLDTVSLGQMIAVR